MPPGISIPDIQSLSISASIAHHDQPGKPLSFDASKQDGLIVASDQSAEESGVTVRTPDAAETAASTSWDDASTCFPVSAVTLP